MEIKVTLNKPYTEEQRIDFIVEQNHRHGYQIKETQTALEAWGYAEAEKQEQEQERINMLTMTPLDFVTFLEQIGISYSEIQNYLAQNPSLDKQLKYCQNVYCGVVKQIVPITVAGVSITSEMVERAFKIKNGEFTPDLQVGQ